MNRRDELDDALLVAVEHTREVQDELVEEPLGTPRSRELATDVEQRAEDVEVLAAETRIATESDLEVAGGEAPQQAAGQGRPPAGG